MIYLIILLLCFQVRHRLIKQHKQLDLLCLEILMHVCKTLKFSNINALAYKSRKSLQLQVHFKFTCKLINYV